MMRKTGGNRFGGEDRELFCTYSLRSPLGDHVGASSRRCIIRACCLEERPGLEMLRLKPSACGELLKTARLKEITKEMSTDKKDKRSEDWS